MNQPRGNPGRVTIAFGMAPADKMPGMVSLCHQCGVGSAALGHGLPPLLQPMLKNAGISGRDRGLQAALSVTPRPHPQGVFQTGGLLFHDTVFDGATQQLIQFRPRRIVIWKVSCQQASNSVISRRQVIQQSRAWLPGAETPQRVDPCKANMSRKSFEKLDVAVNLGSAPSPISHEKC